MKEGTALAAFSALGHPTRLNVFRALSHAAPGAMSAGALAEKTDTLPSTLTTHLQALERAGLVKSRRQSRSILYQLNIEGTRDLVTFLTQDCCSGHPEICRPLHGDST